MTTTANQRIISDNISGPYMVLTMDTGSELVIGRSRFMEDAVTTIAFANNEPGEINMLRRDEVQQAMKCVEALLL